jgi:hypothetical protein
MALIGLLSIMALNVQAACPANGCPSGKYCSYPGSMGECKDKKKGGETCSYAWQCFSNIKTGNVCGCTEQTTSGNKGCKDSNWYCDVSNKKCQNKKLQWYSCKNDYECVSGLCYNKLQCGCRKDKDCAKAALLPGYTIACRNNWCKVLDLFGDLMP